MTVPLENLADGSISDRNFKTLAQAVNPVLPQVRVYNNANISHVTSGVAQALTFNSERWDNGSLHSTSANTSRLTASITGLWSIGANVRWTNNATGYRQLTLRVNGTTDIASVIEVTASAAQFTDQVIGTDYQLAAGDYVELFANQNSGGALNVVASGNISPEFWMHRLGGYTNQGA